MRELNRRAAAVKSRRATPEELREAQERYKAIQDELRQLELAPETKHGEERIERYERELRIRALREEFQSVAETRLPEPRNGVVLALVMTGGGPDNASTTLSLFVYQTGFIGFQMGYASAAALVMLLIIVAFTIFSLRAFRTHEE